MIEGKMDSFYIFLDLDGVYQVKNILMKYLNDVNKENVNEHKAVSYTQMYALKLLMSIQKIINDQNQVIDNEQVEYLEKLFNIGSDKHENTIGN